MGRTAMRKFGGKERRGVGVGWEGPRCGNSEGRKGGAWGWDGKGRWGVRVDRVEGRRGKRGLVLVGDDAGYHRGVSLSLARAGDSSPNGCKNNGPNETKPFKLPLPAIRTQVKACPASPGPWAAGGRVLPCRVSAPSSRAVIAAQTRRRDFTASACRPARR